MMTRAALALGLALTLAAGPGLATSVNGEATYDLLFRDGTLDPVSRDHALVYRREVTNTLNPDAAARDSGEIGLRIERAEDMEMVRLEFRRDGKHRGMGSFPASVGNPMIMVFYESVVRDMAETAGGSPFYIRNRVKDALVQPSEVEPGTAMVDGEEVATRTIRMRPFEGDPNVDRMRGFSALELSVTMSEAVPGWYLSLVAEAPAPDGTGLMYRSSLHFDAEEALQ
ncbi:hypothetical protein ACSSV4_002391 [Roseovarius sp. MBR-154]|jgi:hypothetical protein